MDLEELTILYPNLPKDATFSELSRIKREKYQEQRIWELNKLAE